jgi:hypothetical protein
MGIGSFAAMAPFIFDIVGPLIAHQIRDGFSGDGFAKVKELFTGDKISLENIQKALDLLPAEERIKIEAKLAELNEQISLIQHSSLSDEDKKRRIESVSKQYLKNVPGHASSASTVPASKDFGEVTASWSPEMHDLQRRWFELLPEPEQTEYSDNMPHLAPELASQLRPFLSEKEGQKRVSGLSELEGALKGVSLERYKLWYRTMNPAERSALASMANSKRLTARIVESVLELADVPAPKIPDFETFLDENKIRDIHDEFIKKLDRVSSENFRRFRDHLNPGMLKDKLLRVSHWKPEVARDIYIELEYIAGGSSGAAFDSASATEVLDMVRGRLLDEPITDSPKPELDKEVALTIFRLIKSYIPKPKDSMKDKASKILKVGKDLAGEIDGFIKDTFPYENLALPDFKDENELPRQYVRRIILAGAVDQCREESEDLTGITDATEIDKRNEIFIKRLLNEDKFMGKVNQKENDSIRAWKEKQATSNQSNILADFWRWIKNIVK